MLWSCASLLGKASQVEWHPSKRSATLGEEFVEEMGVVVHPSHRAQAVTVHRLGNQRRVNRDRLSALVGWKPGSWRVVVALQEIDLYRNRDLPGRYFHHLVFRSLSGLRYFDRFRLHWRVSYVDPEGRWRGVHAPSVFHRVVRADGPLNHDMVLFPIEFADEALARKVVDAIEASVGNFHWQGCASAATCALRDGSTPASRDLVAHTTRAFDNLVRQRYGRVERGLVVGTHLEKLTDIRDWLHATDQFVLRSYGLCAADAVVYPMAAAVVSGVAESLVNAFLGF